MSMKIKMLPGVSELLRISLSLLVILSLIHLGGCSRGFYTSAERSMLKKCKVDRTTTNLDDQQIARIESLAQEIINWEYNDDGSAQEPCDQRVHWDTVALSMLKFPDDIIFTEDSCPLCGNQTVIDIFFCSPSKTWEHLCGTAGNMKICTHCKKQLEYIETMVS